MSKAAGTVGRFTCDGCAKSRCCCVFCVKVKHALARNDLRYANRKYPPVNDSGSWCSKLALCREAGGTFVGIPSDAVRYILKKYLKEVVSDSSCMLLSKGDLSRPFSVTAPIWKLRDAFSQREFAKPRREKAASFQ